MQVGWCHDWSEPVLIKENKFFETETYEEIDNISLDDLSLIIDIDDTAEFYISTPDDGYIILQSNPIKIITTNLEEVNMYPFSSVHPLHNDYSHEMFERLDNLADKEFSLENDELIAAA